MRVQVLFVLIVFLLAGLLLSGCARPEGNGTGSDASDLPVGTTSDHPHGGARTIPFCGGYTLTVGNAMEVWAAMETPPENVSMLQRNDTEEWLEVDLVHPNMTVRDAWVRFAFYRAFENGSVLRGVSLTGTDPPVLTIQGTWPDQNETPFALRKILEPLVGLAIAPDTADALWQAWRSEQARGEDAAHLEYGGPLRLGAAWQQLFGDQHMPPRRSQGDFVPEGRATVADGDWVWSVVVPFRTWTNGTHSVYADAFGRFSVVLPEYQPETAVENHLIDWGLPVPTKMFTSLHDGQRCQDVAPAGNGTRPPAAANGNGTGTGTG